MKSTHFLNAAGLLLAILLIPWGAARADTVMYDGMSVVDGQQAFTKSFSVTTPGTLTMTVTDVPWLDVVSDLTFFLSSPKGLMGTTMNGGTESIQVQPGTIYAHWYGDAHGSYDLGVVGVNIQFRPYWETPVPLPASLLLMLSGLTMLVLWFRRKAQSPARY